MSNEHSNNKVVVLSSPAESEQRFLNQVATWKRERK